MVRRNNDGGTVAAIGSIVVLPIRGISTNKEPILRDPCTARFRDLTMHSNHLWSNFPKASNNQVLGGHKDANPTIETSHHTVGSPAIKPLAHHLVGQKDELEPFYLGALLLSPIISDYEPACTHVFSLWTGHFAGCRLRLIIDLLSPVTWLTTTSHC